MKIKITRQHVRASIYGVVLILIAGSIPGYFAMFPDQVFFYVLVLSIHAGNFLLLHIAFRSVYSNINIGCLSTHGRVLSISSRESK